MTNDVVERVAKAIYETAHPVALKDPKYEWKTMEPLYRKTWIAAARAALQAMREPTDAMAREPARVGVSCGEDLVGRDVAVETWTVMIDEALR